MSADRTLRVCQLSESQFQSMADDWQACLARSDAHPLFMGWPWLYSWWQRWSQVLGLQLLLLGVYDRSGELVGIGPFYGRDQVTPTGLRVRRVHLIGNAWHVAPTVRTEYCSLITANERSDDVYQALLEALHTLPWDEWVLCDALESELQRLEQNDGELGPEIYRVNRVRDEGVRIETSGSFDDWLVGLGSNTRLKVFNRRKYLEARGDLKLTSSPTGDSAQFLSRLNAFHKARWGKPAFDHEALLFHQHMIERLEKFGGRVHLSELYFENECVSVLYDVTVAGQRINLQAGYQEDLDPRVALGSLHLGYAIEEAFGDSETAFYDLLAGGGKNHDYKKHYRGQIVVFQTVQLVRNRFLSSVYSKQHKMPATLRRFVNRWLKL